MQIFHPLLCLVLLFGLLLCFPLGVLSPPVLALEKRLYLQEQDAGKGLYRSCWRFALRISARTAPSFMLNMP